MWSDEPWEWQGGGPGGDGAGHETMTQIHIRAQSASRVTRALVMDIFHCYLMSHNIKPCLRSPEPLTNQGTHGQQSSKSISVPCFTTINAAPWYLSKTLFYYLFISYYAEDDVELNNLKSNISGCSTSNFHSLSSLSGMGLTWICPLLSHINGVQKNGYK